MINTLFLSYDGMTDPLGQSQVLPYLKGLSQAGYTVHLVSFEKEERFEQHKVHIQKICDEGNITWHPQAYTKTPPLLSTMKDVRTMRKVAHRLHSEHQFSIIHCRSYIAALVGLKMKQKFGTKFLFDMRGFWANERVDGKIWNLKNPLFKLVYNYFKRKEIQFFSKADHVVSLTHNGKHEILSWENLSISAEKITIIPCCVDLELFNPKSIKTEEQIALKEQLLIASDHFVLGYVGSIGTWYMLHEMMLYFKELHKHNSKAIFLFVTGENPHIILEKAAEMGVPNESIRITSTLHSGVPLHISLFDSSIFFIRPSYSKKASSPTKQGEIMAMEIPLICNAGVGDTDFIVEKYQSGIVLNDLTSESFRKSVKEKNKLDTTTFHAGANDYFSLQKGIESYAKIYARLSENH